MPGLAPPRKFYWDSDGSTNSSDAPRTLKFDSDTDSEASLPELLARTTNRSPFDSDSDDETAADRDSDANTMPELLARETSILYDSDSDEESEDAPSIPKIIHRQPSPIALPESDEPGSTFCDFRIQSITFPTPPSLTDVGTKHKQVLASWREIFGKPQAPLQADVEETDTPEKGSQKRYRQQRITPIPIDKNEPYGDAMDTKSKGLFRFYFINPNGISHHRHLLDFYEILQSMQDHDIDVYGLSEINLDVHRPEIRKQMEDISQEFYGTSILALSTSKLRSTTPYKPGGTCMGISNELCGRYQTSGSDPHGLGRWSFMQLYGKDGHSLVVITAYRVCNANIGTTGASTAFHQQWNLLRTAGKLKPNPRKQFITDLTAEIKKWQSEGADTSS
jgi:hypothetical protein